MADILPVEFTSACFALHHAPVEGDALIESPYGAFLDKKWVIAPHEQDSRSWLAQVNAHLLSTKPIILFQTDGVLRLCPILTIPNHDLITRAPDGTLSCPLANTDMGWDQAISAANARIFLHNLQKSEEVLLRLEELSCHELKGEDGFYKIEIRRTCGYRLVNLDLVAAGSRRLFSPFDARIATLAVQNMDTIPVNYGSTKRLSFEDVAGFQIFTNIDMQLGAAFITVARADDSPDCPFHGFAQYLNSEYPLTLDEVETMRERIVRVNQRNKQNMIAAMTAGVALLEREAC